MVPDVASDWILGIWVFASECALEMDARNSKDDGFLQAVECVVLLVESPPDLTQKALGKGDAPNSGACWGPWRSPKGPSRPGAPFWVIKVQFPAPKVGAYGLAQFWIIAQKSVKNRLVVEQKSINPCPFGGVRVNPFYLPPCFESVRSAAGRALEYACAAARASSGALARVVLALVFLCTNVFHSCSSS